MLRGIFITGTDTNVGKTVVSAALMLRYLEETTLRYWKPVQTGIEADDDSAEVGRLTTGKAPPYDNEILDVGVRLPHPVSPHLAARIAGRRITVGTLVDTIHSANQAAGPRAPRWIVEGAGGVLVPLNERETIADLIVALNLPALIVARSTLGTINHTLLTIEALRRRMVSVAGVIMVGEPAEENRMAIERYGAAEVIAELPWFEGLSHQRLAQWTAAEFDRKGTLFGYLR